MSESKVEDTIDKSQGMDVEQEESLEDTFLEDNIKIPNDYVFDVPPTPYLGSILLISEEDKTFDEITDDYESFEHTFASVISLKDDASTKIMNYHKEINKLNTQIKTYQAFGDDATDEQKKLLAKYRTRLVELYPKSNTGKNEVSLKLDRRFAELNKYITVYQQAYKINKQFYKLMSSNQMKLVNKGLNPSINDDMKIDNDNTAKIQYFNTRPEFKYPIIKVISNNTTNIQKVYIGLNILEFREEFETYLKDYQITNTNDQMNTFLEKFKLWRNIFKVKNYKLTKVTWLVLYQRIIDDYINVENLPPNIYVHLIAKLTNYNVEARYHHRKNLKYRRDNIDAIILLLRKIGKIKPFLKTSNIIQINNKHKLLTPSLILGLIINNCLSKVLSTKVIVKTQSFSRKYHGLDSQLTIAFFTDLMKIDGIQNMVNILKYFKQDPNDDRCDPKLLKHYLIFEDILTPDALSSNSLITSINALLNAVSQGITVQTLTGDAQQEQELPMRYQMVIGLIIYQTLEKHGIIDSNSGLGQLRQDPPKSEKPKTFTPKIPKIKPSSASETIRSRSTIDLTQQEDKSPDIDPKSEAYLAIKNNYDLDRMYEILITQYPWYCRHCRKSVRHNTPFHSKINEFRLTERFSNTTWLNCFSDYCRGQARINGLKFSLSLLRKFGMLTPDGKNFNTNWLIPNESPKLEPNKLDLALPQQNRPNKTYRDAAFNKKGRTYDKFDKSGRKYDKRRRNKGRFNKSGNPGKSTANQSPFGPQFATQLATAFVQAFSNMNAPNPTPPTTQSTNAPTDTNEPRRKKRKRRRN